MNLPTPDSKAYLEAKPFPHAFIDNVFFADHLRLVLDTWPEKHEHYTKNKYEVDKGSTLNENAMGPYIAQFIHSHFQSQEFILWLEKLTGITGIVFDCRKFALHETFSGGSLMPHLDYTMSKATGLQLRINVLLYLNENWKPEYNGNLELYESKPGYGGQLHKSVASIEPLFNRLAIFTMDAATPAWHGSPKPWNGPTGRRSIALNYFSLPEKNISESRTIFSSERYKVKDFIPPIIYKLIR